MLRYTSCKLMRSYNIVSSEKSVHYKLLSNNALFCARGPLVNFSRSALVWKRWLLEAGHLFKHLWLALLFIDALCYPTPLVNVLILHSDVWITHSDIQNIEPYLYVTKALVFLENICSQKSQYISTLLRELDNKQLIRLPSV